MKKIGEKIKMVRKLRKLSQKELANKVGISNSFMCDIETGRTEPSIKTLYKIAEVLDTDIRILI